MITLTMVRITRVTADGTSRHSSFQRHSSRFPALAFTPDENFDKVALWSTVVKASVARLLQEISGAR